MKIEKGVGIYLIMDNQTFGYRRWPAVPRVGEEILLNHGPKEYTVKVKTIVWGVVRDDDPFGCVVNMEVEKV